MYFLRTTSIYFPVWCHIFQDFNDFLFSFQRQIFPFLLHASCSFSETRRGVWNTSCFLSKSLWRSLGHVLLTQLPGSCRVHAPCGLPGRFPASQPHPRVPGTALSATCDNSVILVPLWWKQVTYVWLSLIKFPVFLCPVSLAFMLKSSKAKHLSTVRKCIPMQFAVRIWKKVI